eukprot:1157748-Pyramimonas_sp.AAC.1
MRVTGLPDTLILDMISPVGGPDTAAQCTPWSCLCRCNFKIALVPASNHEWWRRAMDYTPFGASAVMPQRPYLGACV